MPPTVKSLEERIDEIASELEGVARQGEATAAKMDALDIKADGVIAAQNATNVQFAVLIA